MTAPIRTPTKAFEADPSLEFDFFLAEQLGVMVTEIRAMDNLDYLHWNIYFGRKAQKIEIARAKAGGR